MNVLFYVPNTDRAGERIFRIVDMIGRKAKTEVFRSIRDLSNRLSQPDITSAIAVLSAKTEEDLKDLVSIRHMLSDLSLILILPDRKEDIRAIGYGLFPRFLTYMDSNLGEVAEVLDKMLENCHRKEVSEEWGNYRIDD